MNKIIMSQTRKQQTFPRRKAAWSPARPPPAKLSLAALIFLSSRTTIQTVSATDLSVTTPDGTYAAGDALRAQWTYDPTTSDRITTGDLNAFKVELRTCGSDGSSCRESSGAEQSCGETFASLCIRDDGLCLDSDGTYDVVVPADAPAGHYGLKVALASNPDVVFACSSAFDVSAAATAVGEPSLETVSPDPLEVGAAFTARWVYDDGSGEAEGSFQIDLYSCEDGSCNDGGCGVFSHSLCEEESGCYDPGTGDFDVRIPASQALGPYKLRVENVADGTAHCSDDLFYVIEEGGEMPTAPPGQSPFGTPAPTNSPTRAPVPTPAPVPAPTAPPATPPTPVLPIDDSPGSPGTPPSPVPAKSVCDMDAELLFEYSLEDTKLPLITVSHASGVQADAGCLTLMKLWDYVTSSPADVDLPVDLLYTVDPTTGVADTSLTATPTGTWLLQTSVVVTNGVTFRIMGTANEDGDCDELKISSSTKKWYRIMGHGGNIDIYDTEVRSWDVTKSMEHILKDCTSCDVGKSPRSYVLCVSEVVNPDETCDGTAQKDMGECRMDIVKSQVSYLGYDATESYGITWKVRGLCEDLSNLDLFDSVRVYGDLQDSDIHHLWYGQYSNTGEQENATEVKRRARAVQRLQANYGHLGGVWTNNLMHDNWQYGFDPHDDSDYLTISGNECYNNGNHGIIASKRCDHLLVTDNNSYNNGGSGIMLHKSCDDSIVADNEATGNHDAGISLVETSRTTVNGNIFEDNRWGFRVTLGSTDNTFEGNTLIANRYNDIYAYFGADEEVPEVAPFTGINVNNIFHQNVIEYIVKAVVDIEDSDGTQITDNEFIGDEGAGMMFLRATDTTVTGNTGEVTSDTVDESCFTPISNRTPEC